MSPPSHPAVVDESTWRPTRHGILVTVTVTVVLTALIGLALDRMLALAAGWGAALSLTGGLWLATRSSWRIPARFLAGFLIAPLGLAVVGGLASTVVASASGTFSQSTAIQAAPVTLGVGVSVVATAGLMTAIVGACVAVAGQLSPQPLRSLFGVAVRTLAVPLGAAAVLAAIAVIGNIKLTADSQTIGRTVANYVDLVTSFFFTPPSGQPNLSSLLVLVGAAVATLTSLLHSLPVLAVAGSDHEEEILTARRRLSTASSVTILSIIVGAAIDISLRQPQFRDEIGATAYEVLVAATQVGPLRYALATVTVLGCLLLTASYIIKRVARVTADVSLAGYGPIASGATITVAAVIAGGPLVQQAHSTIRTSLPPSTTPAYRQVADGLLAFYGPVTVALATLALALGLTVAIVTVARFLLFVRILPSATAGPALAGAGLFAATTLGGVIGLPVLVFFAGIVGSFIAWDSGQFAHQLGDEIGRHTPTRNIEAVHLTGTVVVGVFATTVAVGALQYATTLTFVDPTAIPAALVVTASAIFLLVFATR